MGHSTDVPLAQRVTTWIELVPRLLAHLQIEHVALASHSAGTIYLLNTLIRCRDILDPNRPLVALVGMVFIPSMNTASGWSTRNNSTTAPWVDPAYSHVTTMKMAQSLPVGVFGLWHHIPKVVMASGAAFNQISNWLPSSSGLGAAESPPLQRNRQRIEREYGLPVELQNELQTVHFKSMFGENTVGADSEALCCLRKGPAGLWGDCDDYALFVRKLSELERSRRADQGNSECQKLRISVYFAETDDMIGKKGQTYMEDCWKGSGGDGFEDVMDFTTTTVSETDHDSVVQSVEVLEQIFLGAGGAMSANL
jgi:hypothetical protein